MGNPDRNRQSIGESAGQSREPRQEGFVELYAPARTQDCLADIIFVPDLNEPETAWIVSQTDNTWLKERLQNKVPSGRVVAFGYSATVDPASSDNIKTYAEKLLREVDNNRGGDFVGRSSKNIVVSWGSLYQENRPIILVGHGLGGVVCEKVRDVMTYTGALQAIVMSGEREGSAGRLLTLTRGIILLNTPHYYPGLKQWAAMNQTNIDNKSIEDVQKAQDNFIVMTGKRGEEAEKEIRVVCCFARNPEPQSQLRLSPIWAILPHSTTIAICSDHFGMTSKPADNPESPGLQVVLEWLPRWLDNLIPKQWAVLIGIDCYQLPKQSLIDKTTFEPMHGCINDVLAVEQYLLNTLQIPEGSIVKLLAPNPSPNDTRNSLTPTFDNINKELETLAKRCRKGDIVYFHFSGYGGMDSRSTDGHTNVNDFFLVPSDFSGNYLWVAHIIDMLNAGLALTAVLDLRRPSGNMPPGDDQTPRQLDNKQGFVVLGALVQRELTAEPPSTNSNYGLLTYCLLHTLCNSSTSAYSETICDAVCHKVRDSSCDKTLKLVGDRNCFFVNKIRSRIHALSVEIKPDNPSVCLLGGILSGVEKNSEYAILQKNFDPSKQIQRSDILGEMRVSKVRIRDSVASIYWTSNSLSMRDQRYLAVLQRRPTIKKFGVRFIAHLPAADDVVTDNDFMKRWDQLRENQTWLYMEPNSDVDVPFRVRINEQCNFEIQDWTGTFAKLEGQYLKPLSAKKETLRESIPKLILRLEHLAKFKVIKELRNPGVRPNTPPTLISVKAVIPSQHQSRKDPWREGILVLKEKEQVEFSFHNLTNQSLSFALLICNSRFGVQVVFPRGEQYMILGPHKIMPLTSSLLMAPGMRKASAAGVPIVSTFKVLACVPPLTERPQLLSFEGVDKMRENEGSSSPSSVDDVRRFLKDLDASYRKGFNWETVDIRVEILP
ncbi:hypothetical protein FGG08_003776 [Glutinoglossum americanum]|uniref:Uncharacterized protein n=1 Tax=Glutinoglossum americanum TaxID=1670608 RepID=A0A9P8I6Y7_9PEZI|nr:hypothetical protein FGG08_003776 [Glutinoglossum americanum]